MSDFYDSLNVLWPVEGDRRPIMSNSSELRFWTLKSTIGLLQSVEVPVVAQNPFLMKCETLKVEKSKVWSWKRELRKDGRWGSMSCFGDSPKRFGDTLRWHGARLSSLWSWLRKKGLFGEKREGLVTRQSPLASYFTSPRSLEKFLGKGEIGKGKEASRRHADRVGELSQSRQKVQKLLCQK